MHHEKAQHKVVMGDRFAVHMFQKAFAMQYLIHCFLNEVYRQNMEYASLAWVLFHQYPARIL